jgi:hypothetical protein
MTTAISTCALASRTDLVAQIDDAARRVVSPGSDRFASRAAMTINLGGCVQRACNTAVETSWLEATWSTPRAQ